MIPILFGLLMLAACGYALACGDRSARMVAAAVLLGSILSMFVIHETEKWQGSETGILAIDIAMLLVFGAVMLVSHRFWPIWTTAAQLLTVLSHFGPLLRDSDIAVPFAIAEQLWSWFILVQLIVVTARRPLPAYDAQLRQS